MASSRQQQHRAARLRHRQGFQFGLIRCANAKRYTRKHTPLTRQHSSHPLLAGKWCYGHTLVGAAAHHTGPVIQGTLGEGHRSSVGSWVADSPHHSPAGTVGSPLLPAVVVGSLHQEALLQ